MQPPTPPVIQSLMPGLLSVSHLLGFLMSKPKPPPQLCYIGGLARGALLVPPFKPKFNINGESRLSTKQKIIRTIVSGSVSGAVLGVHHGWNIGFQSFFCSGVNVPSMFRRVLLNLSHCPLVCGW